MWSSCTSTPAAGKLQLTRNALQILHPESITSSSVVLCEEVTFRRPFLKNPFFFLVHEYFFLSCTALKCWWTLWLTAGEDWVPKVYPQPHGNSWVAGGVQDVPWIKIVQLEFVVVSVFYFWSENLYIFFFLTIVTHWSILQTSVDLQTSWWKLRVSSGQANVLVFPWMFR